MATATCSYLTSTDAKRDGLVFADRCKSIPVFNSTCFWLNEYYNRLKEINTITKYTMELAESTIKTSMCLANPLMQKFKGHVHTLDTLACQQLDRLEAAFPILREDTDKVVSEGKNFFHKTVQPAVNRINTFRTQTEDTCTAFKNYGLMKVESIKCTKSRIIQTKSTKLIKKLYDLSENFLETNLLYDDGDLTMDESLRNYYQTNISSLRATIIPQPSLSTSPTVIMIENEIDLANKIKILTCLLYFAVQKKCLKHINLLIHALDHYVDRLNRIGDAFEVQKANFKVKFEDRINYTKNRLNFYKEYLDLLTKQLTVQDGRSLDHVYVSKHFNIYI